MRTLFAIITGLVLCTASAHAGLTAALTNEVQDMHLVSLVTIGATDNGRVATTVSLGKMDGIPIGATGYMAGGVSVNARGVQFASIAPVLTMEMLFSDAPEMQYRVRQTLAASRKIGAVTPYAGAGIETFCAGGPGKSAPVWLAGASVANLAAQYSRCDGRTSYRVGMVFNQ